MIPDDELDAMEARANRASQGAWMFDGNGNIVDAAESLTFCAHARTDVPMLVAEVRRLKRALSRVLESNGNLALAFQYQVQVLLHDLENTRAPQEGDDG